MQLPTRPARGLVQLLSVSLATLPTRSSGGDHVRHTTGRGARWGSRHLPRQSAYVVRSSRPDGWRWWLESSDGDLLAAAPDLRPTRDRARTETLRVRLLAASLPVETIEDDHGGYRWRVRSWTGAVLAVSAVGYATAAAAERAVVRFRREASHAELHDD